MHGGVKPRINSAKFTAHNVTLIIVGQMLYLGNQNKAAHAHFRVTAFKKILRYPKSS
jgi:hypothetical protein